MADHDSSEAAIGLIDQGNEHWSAGRMTDAFRCYAASFSAAPDSRRSAERLALFMLNHVAVLRSRDGAPQAAQDALRAFLTIEPGNPPVSAELGLQLFQYGKVEESSGHLFTVFAATPAVANYVEQRLRDMLNHTPPVPNQTRARFFGLERLARTIPRLGETFGRIALDLGKAKRPAVCVAGMHRSGSSLLANLLQRAGLDLGPEDRLLPPQPDNPDGFFENREILRLHEDLLVGSGGGWDAPPSFLPGWERAEGMQRFRDRASLLSGALAQGSGELGWGWKDPRNCLTLPLWLDLIPDLKVVVVFRDPGSVAASLQKRGGYLSPAFGLKLWKNYHDALHSALENCSHVVVSYDRLLEDPERELRRVAEYAGWNLSDQRVASAVGCVRRELRHHKPSSAWRALPAGAALAPLFDKLVKAAGELP